MMSSSKLPTHACLQVLRNKQRILEKLVLVRSDQLRHLQVPEHESITHSVSSQHVLHGADPKLSSLQEAQAHGIDGRLSTLQVQLRGTAGCTLGPASEPALVTEEQRSRGMVPGISASGALGVPTRMHAPPSGPGLPRPP